MATSLVNLSRNPACKNNTTGAWFGPSGWARSTSVHASLPRTTGFEGIAAGSVICSDQIAITAGAAYVASVYIFSPGNQTLLVHIDWYGPSGFLTAGPVVPYSITGGANATRLDTGTGVSASVAPPGATRLVLVVDGIDGPAEFTGVMITLGTELHPYFDGDTAGCNWASTPGNSISYRMQHEDTWSLVDSGFKLDTAPGPVGGEHAAFTEVGAVVATGTAEEEIGFAESALIVSSSYDDRFGRIRISAHGLPATAVRAVVSSRPINSSTWTEVRGGRVTIIGGAFARQVDDYEFPSGVPVFYRIVVYSTTDDEGVTQVVVATAQIQTSADSAGVWIKFIAAPQYNRRVRLIGWGRISRESRNATYDVKGARAPVVVTDVHSSRQLEVRLHTRTLEEAEDLDEALRSGFTIFFHTPAELPLPSMYAAIGSYQWVPPTERSVSTQASWSVPLTEVSAPPPSVVGAVATWATVSTAYGSWQQLLDEIGTWGELL